MAVLRPRPGRRWPGGSPPRGTRGTPRRRRWRGPGGRPPRPPSGTRQTLGTRTRTAGFDPRQPLAPKANGWGMHERVGRAPRAAAGGVVPARRRPGRQAAAVVPKLQPDAAASIGREPDTNRPRPAAEGVLEAVGDE